MLYGEPVYSYEASRVYAGMHVMDDNVKEQITSALRVRDQR